MFGGGSTFFPVEIPFKVAVDPCFVFEPSEHAKDGTHFFEIKSDEFFKKLDCGDLPLRQTSSTQPIKFDIIFIDGYHTFEQSFRDFENSLRYSHKKTLWLIDDTVPSDAYSALPNPEISSYKRHRAGLDRGDWHGDVYKTIFAIHDRFPEISYCTLMGGNPQTVLWKAERSTRAPLFSSISEIESASYYDMIRHGKVMMPITDETLPNYIFRSIDPALEAAPDSWRQVITKPNFRNLSPEVTLMDLLVVSCKQSVPARAYLKFNKDGLGAVLKAIKNKLRENR
ncbi:class I SAM-dependent methyltransferase [Thiobacillus sp.]|uniref:class I SAM-dependent methyltransferase n=1 Tax=Thiobacillus sp. TaxID=924 RepID=UPI0025D6BDCE|nr:class I SAM-dependent methyltransferase [Thiobacillus sp.]MBT9540095.1 class I SAM-dependent methyltransferase [Thiobacillus sp.]